MPHLHLLSLVYNVILKAEIICQVGLFHQNKNLCFILILTERLAKLIIKGTSCYLSEFFVTIGGQRLPAETPGGV